MALLVGLAALLLYLLATATASNAMFTQHYRLLLGLNAALAVLLAGIVGWQLWSLRRRVRAGVFGTRLTARLVLFFTLVAVLPGVLLYAVSVNFIGRSIESWFDVRVDKALEGGLALGRSTLDNLLRDTAQRAEAMANALAERSPAQQITTLNALRDQFRVEEAALFSARGTVLAFAGTGLAIAPELSVVQHARQIRAQQPYTAVEAMAERGLYLRVIVPVNLLSLTEDIRMLQLMQPVPEAIAGAAEEVRAGAIDYQELAYARHALRQLYGLTLTLTLLLAVLASLAGAIYLSERLASPLGILAEGTRAVAQGDYRPRETVAPRDELGMLTGLFNQMTRQLDEARAAVERNQAELRSANAYLEGVLGSLSAGVLSFGADFRLRASNSSANRILEVDLANSSGQAPVGALLEAIRERFARAGHERWEAQLEYHGAAGIKVLLLRGTRLEAGADSGYVVVFDDITRLLQAQRDAAWGEVARRLAHEIKNPLTPIQLSAERLALKLRARLGAADAEMLERSTQTIVNQVTALKSMVDAFAEYARSSRDGASTVVDLNELAREVLRLYESQPEAIGAELEPALPLVMGRATELRQVLHNLLQNAQDAVAGVPDARIALASERTAHGVRVSVTDNGHGFPRELLARAFEPYVTTKPRGTGLGLAIVKKIIDEHGGTIVIENLQPRGARVSFTLPVAAGAEQAAA
jgi:nitrogen fixation/metabolism regulation signal transduction histidine kinase